jgi:hypothetical protein
MEGRSSVGQILQLVNEQGAYIGAATALFFFLLEVFFDLGRTHKRSLVDNAKTAFLLLGAFASMFYAFWSLQNEYEPMTEASRARRAITAYYDRCLERVQTFGPELKADIVSDRLVHVRENDRERTTDWLLQLDCLALAFRNAPVGADQTAQVGWLNKDVALGEQLLRGAEDDETTIASTMYRMFGVDSSDFLGIGRSLPLAEESSHSRYSEAVMREYWAPNVCVVTSIDPTVCPRRWTRAWGWRFDSLNHVQDLSLREMLLDPQRAVLPMEGGDTIEYRQFLDRLGRPGGLEEPTHLLVRFHTFPNSFYLGTVGRPEARHVFLSSLADSIDLPIREAFRRSGARDPDETRQNAPDNRAFIWIYEPVTTDEYRLSTWRNLFAYLRELRVDSRVREAAEARDWAPPPHPPAQAAASEAQVQ